ncbi:ATP-binding cassette domain-containing protein [Halalkalibacillus halophilus]|uniref:ATP-binding cassette domain-containing protein n=1 Tax=Halalkalibacillus halophilus TaxID=392827 RepID=UPI0003F6CC64|nr:ABC transporter ATP-binding protein [Halalkalibacillus halophilus]
MIQSMELSRLEKEFDGLSLGPINHQFEPDLIHVLVGNNGAGKSTLLKIMMQLVNPEAGETRINGRAISQQDEWWKPHISYLPQNQIGFDAFKGEQLHDLNRSWYESWDEELFQTIVKELHVPLNKKVTKLSNGMKQKLFFALTLARNTEIMLLDEPTNSMDLPSKQFVMDCIVEWMEREGRTILFTTHQIEEVRKLADHIMLIKDGQKIGSFNKDELTAAYVQLWMKEPLPSGKIPGEKERKGERLLISENAHETKTYLQSRNIEWIAEEPVDIETTITDMLR